jgi:hypothetical protein
MENVMAQVANALQLQAQAMQAQHQAGGEAHALLLNQLLALNQTLVTMGPLHSGLVQRLPTFAGSTKDNALNAWLEQAETLFQAMNCSDAQRLALARTCLTGVAGQFVTQLIQAAPQEEPLTWEAMKQQLIRRFIPHNQAFLLRKKLTTLKYREGQDIQTFLFEFQKTLSALDQSRVGDRQGTPNENDKMHFLLEALPPKLQTAMLVRQPADLQTLTDNVVAYCQARLPLQTNAPQPMEVDALKDVDSDETDSQEEESLEQALNAVFRRFKKKQGRSDFLKAKQKNKQKERKEASFHVNASGKTFEKNNKFRHSGNSNNQQPSSKTNEACYRCGTPGHFASECYARPEKVRAFQRQRTKTTPKLHQMGEDSANKQALNEDDSSALEAEL